MIRVSRLCFDDGSMRQTADSVALIAGFGILGDVKGGGKTRQVCLSDKHAVLATKTENGLCGKRFFANIETTQLDYTALVQGDRLKIGTAVLTIAAVKKRCFCECALVQAGKPCALPNNTAFATVEAGGTIRNGQQITLLRQEER